MIDLGLPSGTKWACCNLGAKKPEDLGNIYAWGETKTKDYYSYSMSTYEFANRYDGEGYKSYYEDGVWWDDPDNIGSDIAGTQYDAARANWGAKWQMPSKTQFEELIKHSTYIEYNLVVGKIKGTNGFYILIPNWGNYSDEYGNFINNIEPGSYWSSTIDLDGYGSPHNRPYYLDMWRKLKIYEEYRWYGLSVRPVAH